MPVRNMPKHFFKKITEFADLSNHTPRRVFNKILNSLSRYMAVPHVYGLPSHLIVEISSTCQLRCPLCPLGSRTIKRQSQIMDFDTFKKVVDDVGDYVYHFNINGMGEPLMNKRVIDMITYAKEKNIYTDLYTNFQLQDREIIEGLVSSGLDSILISLDGATKEVYETYRIKGDFERILNNIRLLVETRACQKSVRPEINIQFVMFEHNRSQLNQMTELVKSLGADNLFVKRPFLFWGKKEDASSYISKDDKFNKYEMYNSAISLKARTRKTCDAIWAGAVVLADGSVAPCCFDYDGKVLFGNINHNSFKYIWNNKKYTGFRKQVRDNWKKVPLCNKDFEGGCPNMYIHPDDWLIRIGN